MKYTYLGSTIQSVAFKARNELTSNDYGVFNYPVEYVRDEDGNITDEILLEANPLFTAFFGMFDFSTWILGQTSIEFANSCIAYLEFIQPVENLT